MVLVTGAAKRLGREIALTLAAAGWVVAVHCRCSLDDATQTAQDCARLAGMSDCFFADLANEDAVRQLVPAVVAKLGHIDAVVHNAAVFEHDTASTFGFAAMERHMRCNTGAAILLSHALHAHLQSRLDKAGGVQNAMGVVVNLLDQKLWNPNPDFFSYTLSKAALEAATTLLAQALSPRVRVVGVAPGLTLPSPMITPDQFDRLHQMSPLGRSSCAADVAATVAFALANPSITGTTLLVDGGQHLMHFERDFSLMPPVKGLS